MSTSTRLIWLIRHGESEANAGLPTSDPAAIGLTERGQAQAHAVAAAFERAPDLIVCSPYARTQATAAPTRARFPAARHEQWPVQEFTYLDPRRCAGTTAAQRLPWVEEYWRRGDPAHCDGGGAESLLGLLARVEACLGQLTALPSGFAALFTHGHFIKTLLWRLLARPASVAPAQMGLLRLFLDALPMPNGAIVPLRLGPDGDVWVGPVRTEHLPAD
ncbi:MAG TPA: histidine phosphatase family protein [Roseiflexaceae bacterium]|nr:histidine phosphatase family protein [Roseiflexaceae bacterium]